MYLTREQITAVLRKAYRESAREHAMFLLAYTHGLRVGEVAALTFDAVQDGLLRVQRLKGSLATVQPLKTDPSAIYDEPSVLSRWLALRGDPDTRMGRVFPLSRTYICHMTHAFMVRAGIPPELAHFHQFKHAICSQLCRAGVPVEYVRQYVGHKDIKNTVIYLNISDAEAAAKAQKALGGMK